MLHRALLLVLLGLPSVAAAQTRGLALPTPSLVEPDGVDSLHINPAGLTTLSSWELRLHNTQSDQGEGEGTSLLFGMPLFAGLSTGFGLDLNRPAGARPNQRLSLGVAYRLNRFARFGLAYRHVFAPTDPVVDGTDTLDLGVLLRPAGWLTLAGGVRDAPRPRVGGVPVPRKWYAGLGIQPGTDRVTIEGNVDVLESDGALAVGSMLRIEPLRGLQIRAWGRYGTSKSREGELAVGGSLALEFGRVGASGGAFVTGKNGLDGGLGWTVSARASGASYGPLVGRSGKTIIVNLGGFPEQPKAGLLSSSATWLHLMRYLDRLRLDDSVAGVLIRHRGWGGGWAQSEELRDRILELKKAGKTVTIYLDQGDLRHLYAFSAADRIVLNPAGGFMITGLRAVISYYKTALDRLGIGTQWVKYGKYKSYPEVFSRTGPSEPAREVRNDLLDTLYDALVKGIAAGRGKTPEQIKATIDVGPFVAAECLEHGLVDKLLFWDEVQDWMRKEHGAGLIVRAGSGPHAPEAWGAAPLIAVIVVEGSIVDGVSKTVPLLNQKSVGGVTIVKAVEQAAANPEVEGILLRINSPGGSSVASDHMHRALQRAAKGKPLVASMGNVAASGGYYIAMGAREVLAGDLTVTGSIGIFTGKPAFGKVYAWLGIGRETFYRGKNAGLFGTDKPWTPAELKLMQEKIKVFYDMFLQRVADNRGMTVEEVDKVAQGRVWFGSQAKAHNLTDTRGGALDALRRVKVLSGLEPDDRVRLTFYPRPTLTQRVRNTIGIEILLERMGGLKDALALAYPFLNGFAPGEPLALMPFDLRFESGR